MSQSPDKDLAMLLLLLLLESSDVQLHADITQTQSYTRDVSDMIRHAWIWNFGRLDLSQITSKASLELVVEIVCHDLNYFRQKK